MLGRQHLAVLLYLAYFLGQGLCCNVGVATDKLCHTPTPNIGQQIWTAPCCFSEFAKHSLDMPCYIVGAKST